MKKILLIIAVTLIAVSCIKVKTTTTEVKRVSEIRQLNGFKAVAIDGSPKVRYKQDSVWSVKVYASEEMMPNVRTEVVGWCLKVSLKGDLSISKEYKLKIGNKTIVGGGGEVDVVVSSPDLIGIGLNGSGAFIAEGKIDTDKLDVVLRGSGEIECQDILCDTISIEAVGSGSVKLMKVDALASYASLVGSGDIKMWQQNVRQSAIQLKGSGDITVDFKDCGDVACDLQGSGDIRLSGNVETFKKETLGSGDYELARLSVSK